MKEIRLARLDDISSLIEMGRHFHAAYIEHERSICFDAEHVRALLVRLITEPAGLVMVAVVDRLPIGMFVAMCHGGITSPSLQATELAWWVEPEHRGSRLSMEMLQRYEAWAIEKGCALATLACIQPFKGDMVRRLYERMGFRGIEQSFAKRLA